MADETKETTIFIDSETKRKVGLVAKAYERSMAAQVRYWANRDFAELERLKLLPREAETKEPQAQG